MSVCAVHRKAHAEDGTVAELWRARLCGSPVCHSRLQLAAQQVLQNLLCMPPHQADVAFIWHHMQLRTSHPLVPPVRMCGRHYSVAVAVPVSGADRGGFGSMGGCNCFPC